MTNFDSSSLDENTQDRLVGGVASGIKIVSSALPCVGPLISELINNAIPNLRLERIVDFLKALELKVTGIDNKFENFKSNLSSEEGMDLFEEGLLQASRAVNKERKLRLASILARSLSLEELRYDESKKILNIFRELTDHEVIWLLYYASNPVIGNKGQHAELVQKYPEVLTPLSRISSEGKEHQKKLALQDSYKRNLLRLGLVEQGKSNKKITVLGRVLIDYISS